MRNTYSLRNQHHDFNIERFKTRLTAKCCVVFVAVTQIIIRIIILIIHTGGPLDTKTIIMYAITLPLLALIALLVCFEYFLFKRIGPKVMNYSKYFDIALLVIFTAEWIIYLLLTLIRITETYPQSLGITSVYTFIDFAWRTLFLLFLIQGWKLLIIPPTIAILLVIVFSICNVWTPNFYVGLLGFPQMFYTIMMLYFLDKIKWKEVFTNTQQERWTKINEFVLNNIPENIIILDLEGEVNFISDYCRAFMHKAHLSQNPRDLWTNITELYQQPETEPSSPSNVFYFE